jgi:hypothetical protein
LGVKCDRCPAWSEVFDTRERDGVVRRRRRCANNHVFTTYEVHATVWRATRYRQAEAAAAAERRRERHLRDMRILADLKTMTGADVARKWDMTKANVSRIKRAAEKRAAKSRPKAALEHGLAEA